MEQTIFFRLKITQYRTFSTRHVVHKDSLLSRPSSANLLIESSLVTLSFARYPGSVATCTITITFPHDRSTLYTLHSSILATKMTCNIPFTHTKTWIKTNINPSSCEKRPLRQAKNCDPLRILTTPKHSRRKVFHCQKLSHQQNLTDLYSAHNVARASNKVTADRIAACHCHKNATSAPIIITKDHRAKPSGTQLASYCKVLYVTCVVAPTPAIPAPQPQHPQKPTIPKHHSIWINGRNRPFMDQHGTTVQWTDDRRGAARVLHLQDTKDYKYTNK